MGTGRYQNKTHHCPHNTWEKQPRDRRILETTNKSQNTEPPRLHQAICSKTTAGINTTCNIHSDDVFVLQFHLAPWSEYKALHHFKIRRQIKYYIHIYIHVLINFKNHLHLRIDFKGSLIFFCYSRLYLNNLHSNFNITVFFFSFFFLFCCENYQLQVAM